MRYTLAGTSLLIIGILLIILGGFQGGFLLIFPMIITTSPLGGLGVLMIMLGGIILFLGLAMEPLENAHEGYPEVQEETHSRGVGLVLIGPAPLLIDTDNRDLTLISLALFAAGIGILLLFLL